MVLSAERDGLDRALDGVGIEFDAFIVEEAAKGVPACQCTADRIRTALRRQPRNEGWPLIQNTASGLTPPWPL